MKEDIYKKDNEKHSSGWIRLAVKILLPLFVLCAGIAGASYIKKTAPKPRKRNPSQSIPLVQTAPVYKSDEQVVLKAMGTVIPAREMVLRAKVSGEVISIHPEFFEGGFLKADEEILKIDPKDYELGVTQKQSQVADAVYKMKLEMGQQDIAKREWRMINGRKKAKNSDIELALRKPHLQKAKADLTAAKAELEQAKIYLSRTRITSPFNALVRSENIESGSQLASGEQIAELIGSDEFWIQVSVPVDRLRWIKIPRKAGETGSPVTVRYGDAGYERKGNVVRLLSELESQGRMARIMVSVKDPLDLQTPSADRMPLLIGEYVHVEIKGKELKNVARIHRSALRDNNKIWIAGPDKKLHIREVKTIWRDQNTVMIQNNISDGEHIILSGLSAPVENMRIAVSSEQKP